MLGARIIAVSNGRDVIADSLACCRAELGEAPQELRLELLVQSEHVREYEHLAVAIGTRADTDRGDADGATDLTRQAAGHEFEHDGERAGHLEPLRLCTQPFRVLLFAALHTESAQRMDGLRREADVAHDRD